MYKNTDNIKSEYLQLLKEKKDANISYMEKIFKESYDFEKALDKPVYEFNKANKLELYKTLNYGIYGTLRIADQCFNKFLKWCMNYVGSNNIHLEPITSEEIMDCLSDPPKIVSKDDIINSKNLLINYCDKVMIEAIYNGIKGEGWSELFGLRMQDIKKINSSKCLVNLSSGRVIDMDVEFYNLAKMAADEFDYYLIDGRTMKLSTNPYPDIVIKKMVTNGSATNSNVLSGKLKRFKKLPGFCKDIGLTSLYDSGIVHKLQDVQKRKTGYNFEDLVRDGEAKKVFNYYGYYGTAVYHKYERYAPYFE